MPRFHPACLLFPKLGPQELQELADDIREHGLRNPIVLYEGKVLDGRNRLAACKVARVKPRFIQWNGTGSPAEWVISENLIRRHLTSSQRAVVAHDLLPLLEKEAKARQRLSLGRGKKGSNKLDTPLNGAATKVAARLFKTNHTYVQSLKNISTEAPDLVEEIRSGKITVPEARELARSPQSIRKKVLSVVNSGGPRRKVSRAIRDEEIAVRKATARQYASQNGSHRHENILHGDMATLWKRLQDDSVKLFLTDPPFAQPDLYGRLAELAAAKLVPGGLCLAYADTGRLPEVLDAMREHLSYWWCMAIPHTDVPRYINDRHILSKWKPIVAFGRMPVPHPPEWLGDLFVGGRRDKRFHRWGQPEGEAAHLVTRLTEPGDLVVDPFCGGGTVAAACKVLGRKWLATEIDRDTVAIARKRLSDVKVK